MHNTAPCDSRQVPMLKQEYSEWVVNIRDNRAAVPHDPEGPERERDPSSTDADHRQDRSQSVQKLLEVSQDSPSTGTSMLSRSNSDKFLRSKRLRSPARWRFVAWNRLRGARRCQSSTRARRHIIALRSRRQWTRQVSRECSHRETAHMQVPELKLPRHTYARPQSGCASIEREKGEDS